jgi:hypothetical protein
VFAPICADYDNVKTLVEEVAHTLIVSEELPRWQHQREGRADGGGEGLGRSNEGVTKTAR